MKNSGRIQQAIMSSCACAVLDESICFRKYTLAFKDINTFIQQGCIRLIKSDSTDISVLFFLTSFSSKSAEKKEKSSWFLDKCEAA